MVKHERENGLLVAAERRLVARALRDQLQRQAVRGDAAAAARRARLLQQQALRQRGVLRGPRAPRRRAGRAGRRERRQRGERALGQQRLQARRAGVAAALHARERLPQQLRQRVAADAAVALRQLLVRQRRRLACAAAAARRGRVGFGGGSTRAAGGAQRTRRAHL